MPSEFGSSTTTGYIYSVYANYTPDQQDQDIELIGNPYMFTGRRYDLETGLYYYRARYYNPYIGRFLQTDPIGYGDGMNLYSYCGSNPLNYVDFSGLAAIVSTDTYMILSAVTGNIMVLPWRLDPEILSMCYNLEAFFEVASDIPQVILPSIPSLTELLEEVSPTDLVPIGVATAYLNVASTLIGALPGVLAEDTNLWRGFFEVMNYYLVINYYDDGSSDCEIQTEYVWIEAVGLRSGLTDDDGWYGVPGAGGYWRKKDAFYATLRAMLLYDYWWLGLAEVPESWLDPWGPGYIYSGPFVYDDAFYDFVYNFIYGNDIPQAEE